MEARQTWLEAVWPKVAGFLPPPPAAVVEVGCGRHGGFVPALLAEGFQALGVDPAAPEGESYRQVEFERAELPPRVDAIVACTSLHHVADPAVAVDKMADKLGRDGVVVIVEWDWESFDEATAEWCFERLGSAQDDDEGWLSHQHRHWVDSQLPWERYLQSWAARENIHTGSVLIHELDRRFERISCQRGPYFFADLQETTEADELRMISDGRIRATRIDYVGRPR